MAFKENKKSSRTVNIVLKIIHKDCKSESDKYKVRTFMVLALDDMFFYSDHLLHRY
jgi:hypothetical protein